MKISTKGRYGLRALIDLAIHSNNNKCVSLSSISERQDLSLNYLESIFAYLKRGKLVISMAGSQGGYMLSRPASDITLYDILTVLEGDLSVYDSLSEETKIRNFLNRNVWDIIDTSINKVLINATLNDVLNDIESQHISKDCSGL